jgi:hypothetical protein
MWLAGDDAFVEPLQCLRLVLRRFELRRLRRFSLVALRAASDTTIYACVPSIVLCVPSIVNR